jgi:two-component system, OmpR family, KDP operon response regulator KdpE
MSTVTILVIDDDIEIRRLVFKTLTPAGYKVKFAEKKREPIRQIFSSRCNLVILGEESADASYVTILNNLRAWSTIPVIVISSLLPEKKILAPSVAGANDYIVFPFSFRELLTSVRSTLQSYNTTNQGIKFEIDSIAIDFENSVVSKKGKRVKLTPTEFSLLSLFVHNAGKLLTYDHILQHIRGPWFENKIPYSRVYVGRLRKKLENDPDRPQLFQTESRRGYRFVVKQ